MKHLIKTLPLAFGLSATLGYAANGSWNIDAAGNWSDIANWNGTIADGADSTATFTNDITTDRIVTLDSDRTIGNITFGDAATGTAAGWTISGGTLTLDRTSGTPTITLNVLGTSKTATISSVIAGNDGLTVTSTGANGTLTLSGANTYSGQTTINTQANGATGVIANHASAFGTSTVLVNGSNQFNSSLSVAAGVNIGNALTLKSIASGSARALVALGSGSTWSGNITVDSSSAPAGGFAGFIAGGTSAATASTISGNISHIAGTNTSALVLRSSNNYGQITGSVSLANATVQLLDTTNWMFTNTSNTWGTLDINNNGATVYVGAINALSSTGVVTCISTSVNGTLRLNNMAGTTAYSQTIAGLGNNVRVALSTGAATLTLNTTANQTHTGVISNGITLTKTGNATQSFSGANTYTGGTNINDGTLQAGHVSALGTGAVSIGGGNLTTTVTNLGTGALSLTSGSLALNGSTAGTATLGLNTDFTMSGGQWVIDLGNGTDQILGNGAGADFLISGGTLNLGGGAINYGSTYTLLTGFATGSVNGLTISNYDTTNYIASLGNNGVLSFSPVSVPEPSITLVSSLGLLGLLRRRRK